MSIPPPLLRWLLIVGGAYLLIGLGAWFFQRRLIYFPDSSAVEVPAALAREGLRNVTIEAADGVTLQAWHWPGSKSGTVLFFHGNAGNRAGRVVYLEGLHKLGYGVLMPDYRGYGGSEGTPSEQGFYADAAACRAWLAKNAPGPVAYLGSSIGSGPACELATEHPPDALVLQCAITSLPDIASKAYPWLPVRWLLSDRYENKSKLASVTCPVLVIHGDADHIAPIAGGRALYDAAPEPKVWLALEGAGHNDVPYAGGRAYWDGLRDFLDTHVARAEGATERR